MTRLDYMDMFGLTMRVLFGPRPQNYEIFINAPISKGPGGPKHIKIESSLICISFLISLLQILAFYHYIWVRLVELRGMIGSR